MRALRTIQTIFEVPVLAMLLELRSPKFCLKDRGQYYYLIGVLVGVSVDVAVFWATQVMTYTLVSRPGTGGANLYSNLSPVGHFRLEIANVGE